MPELFHASRLLTLVIATVTPCLADEGDPGQRSRTINQRLTAVWDGERAVSFTKELPDGSVELWKFDFESDQATRVDTATTGEGDSELQGGPVPRSQPSALETSVEFLNETDRTVQLFWVEPNGRERPYSEIAPGQSHSQHTFAGHAWIVQSKDGTFHGSLVAQSPPTVAKIRDVFPRPRNRDSGRSRRPGGRERGNSLSKDGRFSLSTNRGALRVRDNKPGEPEWTDLEVGSLVDHEIRSAGFSPDGKFVAAWKVREYRPEDAVTIESSPKNGGRAIVHRRPYRLPGDKYDTFELLLFDSESGTRLEIPFPVIDFGRPRLRWFGNHRLVIEKVDRGHQRVRLFVVDPQAGDSYTVVDESSTTFLWTQHGPSVPPFTYLDQSDRVLYASETSGYRHLYLVDLNDRSTDWRDNAITSGDWLVRRIEGIDEQAGTIDVMAGCYHDDQDPYHQHLIRASLECERVVAITDSDGDHTVQFSPGSNFVIATHSRVDSPPVHELRDAKDGSLIEVLARAERVSSAESDWTLPKVFHAKGRDGETEIWGNLYFPFDFDPERKAAYPIIEAIYAGPHDSHVPKRYLHASRFEELRELGFVVVQIDGMGTANRSKAFHDVCWHNLKDAGFPDRIAWMKAASEEYPAIDPSRVGVFGTSAGGQNACGALLFHGDFYKAAYASCGCHDNRMDKASWNEQWMGYPVGDHYASNSNIDNAHRLRGDLFLVVGELDSNVPPESTLRLVDALVRADKTFDFLMVPGMGHSDGGRYGRRRMREFFVEKLLSIERP